MIPAASQRAFGSVQASVALASPAAMRGSHSARCAAEPASAIAAPPSSTRRRIGAGHHGAADLLHQHDQIGQAEPAAAVGLGKGDPEPAVLGQLTPEFRRDGRLGRHHVAHEPGRAVAVEKLARGIAQQFLFFAEADIHAAACLRRNAAGYAQAPAAGKPAPQNGIVPATTLRCMIAPVAAQLSPSTSRCSRTRLSHITRSPGRQRCA